MLSQTQRQPIDYFQHLVRHKDVAEKHGLTADALQNVLDAVKRALRQHSASYQDQSGRQGTFLLSYQPLHGAGTEVSPENAPDELLRFQLSHGDVEFASGLDGERLAEDAIRCATTAGFRRQHHLDGGDPAPSGFYRHFYRGSYADGDCPLLILNTENGRFLCAYHDEHPDRALAERVLASVASAIACWHDLCFSQPYFWMGAQMFALEHKMYFET